MKKKIFLMVIIALSVVHTKAQYSFDIELKNLRQADETTIFWDLFLRAASGSQEFRLYNMQADFEYNTSIINTGAFENQYFTVVGGPEMTCHDDFFRNADCTAPFPILRWAVVSPPNSGEPMTLITNEWIHVATFSAQLRKNGNPHNFACLDPQFAFLDFGPSVIVYRSINNTETYDGLGNTPVDKNLLIPAVGVPVNTRELAGYCFTGDGDWDATARWNNVTTENANTLPGASNNAIIAGSATLTDTRTVRQLTVADGGYLLIGAGEDNLGRLTVSDQLFDDNTVSGGETTVLAEWDFEDETIGETDFPYYANEFSSSNNEANLNTTATPMSLFDFASSGGTKAPRASNFYFFDEDEEEGYYYSWVIQYNTLRYENLKLSSKQRSVSTGPTNFKIQYSLNGSTWEDVPGGDVSVNTTWTLGVVSNLSLPTALNNSSICYLRYQSQSQGAIGSSAIDDIIITGDPLPTGIRMQSTTYGTGSLIHNNAGITATAERYLPGAVSAWHMISAPVGGMEITNSSWHPDVNNPPGLHTEDFFVWYEPGIWVNFKNQDGSGGIPSFPVANSNNNFITGRGYLINYYSANPTKEFQGPLNYGGIQVPLEKSNTTPPNWQGVWDEAQAGWNLIGNPYASGLDWDAVVKTDILAETYAQVYDPNRAGSPGYQVVNDISSGQGFFVLAVADDVTLSLSNTQQIHGGTYLKQETVSAGDMLVLRVSNDEFFDEARIFLNPSSSFDHDFYDASKLFSFNPEVPQIYTQASGGRWLTINSIPSIAEAYHIPVSLKVPSDGLMSITLAETVGEFSSQTVILHDKFNNTDHNLTETPTCYFTANACDTLHRFELKFGALNVRDLSGDNRLLAYIKDNYLFIMNQGKGEAIVEIFNTSGQLIGYKQIGIGLQHIPVTFPRGAYLLRMISSQEVATGKIVIQ